MLNRLSIAILSALFSCSALAAETIVIDGVVYRDPMQPKGVNRTAAEEGRIGQMTYEVTFIRTGGEINVAVVNGLTVGEGDTVDGALVKAIDKDTVTLDVNGESLDISTFRASFRTPAQDE